MSGITHLDQFKKPALRALVDLTTAETPLTVADRFLPTEETYNRQFAYDIVKNNSFLAAYIGYGAEPPVVDRNAIANKMGEIAYFGLQDIVTYEELQAIHEARNNGEKTGAIDKITIQAIDLLNGMNKLINIAKMEALTKGTFTYNGNNVKAGFTYDIPAENKVALTVGNDFNTADFDAIGFLSDEVDKYVVANGKTPDVMWVSRELNAKLLKNANIIAEAGRPTGSIRVSQDELTAVLDAFGLPSIQVIGQRSTSWKDSYTDAILTREFMPVNRIVMLSEGAGKYLLGPTLENDFQPGLFLEAKDKDDPIRSIIQTFGAGFPILEKPSLVYHIDAYTPV